MTNFYSAVAFPWSSDERWVMMKQSRLSSLTLITGKFSPKLYHTRTLSAFLTNHSTGVVGVAGILNALLLRSENGGSYTVDVALNYYSTWLVSSCGTYPEAIWQDVWKRNDRQVFRHYHNMLYTIPPFLSMLKDNSEDVLFKKEFFERKRSEVLGVEIESVKPILQFPDGAVELRYNVGTRGNGIDAPRWPEDLGVEVVV